MVSPGLSTAGIRFSILPSPAEDLGLPCGRLTAGGLADPIGVYTFRMREIRFGVGLSYAPGPLVFALRILRFLRPDAARYHHIDPGLMTSPNDTYTQRFTFVDPSELHLARVARLVRARLGHFEQLHMEPLPAPHVPDGDGVEHYSGLSL